MRVSFGGDDIKRNKEQVQKEKSNQKKTFALLMFYDNVIAVFVAEKIMKLTFSVYKED